MQWTHPNTWKNFHNKYTVYLQNYNYCFTNNDEILALNLNILTLGFLITLSSLQSTVCTQQSALNSLHSTVYTKQSTPNSLHLINSLHSTVYTWQFTLNSVHTTVYTRQSTLDSLHSTIYTQQSTVNSLHPTVYTQQFTLDSLHSTVYRDSLYSTDYTRQSTLNSLQTLHTWPLDTIDCGTFIGNGLFAPQYSFVKTTCKKIFLHWREIVLFTVVVFHFSYTFHNVKSITQLSEGQYIYTYICSGALR